MTNLHATASAIDVVPVTPSDVADLDTQARAIRCRGDGDSGLIRVTTAKGSVRNTYIAAGELLTVQVVRVHATGTTATNLEALI